MKNCAFAFVDVQAVVVACLILIVKQLKGVNTAVA